MNRFIYNTFSLSSYKNVNYLIFIRQIILATLFFNPIAEITIPTSTIVQNFKLSSNIFTLVLLIFTFFICLSDLNKATSVKTATLAIVSIIALILSSKFLIHLQENGHSINSFYSITEFFSAGKYLIGFYLELLLLPLGLVIYTLKKCAS